MSNQKALSSGFPVMGWGIASWMGAIPWDAIMPHEAQCHRNHSQSPMRLAERGGLTPCELVAVLEDRKYSLMPHEQAESRLRELCPEWEV